MRRPRALSKPAAPSDKSLRHVQRAKEIGTTEAHVQETVTQFLEADGWRAIRTEHAIERNEEGDFKRRVGEVGMPDYLYVRYSEKVQYDKRCEFEVPTKFWIEFKAPGKKPDAHQLAWHEAERARGALVLVVDDIDDFMKRWYPQSGLQRR